MADITENIDHHAAIYTLAKAGDVLRLTCYLAKYPGALDTPKAGTKILSAAASLAKEDDRKAVRILLELGARTDYVIYGAALGGHHNFIRGELKSIHFSYIKDNAKFIDHIKQALKKHSLTAEKFVPDSVEKHNDEHRKFRECIAKKGIKLPASTASRTSSLGAALSEGIALIAQEKMNWSDLNIILSEVLDQIEHNFQNWAALGSAEGGYFNHIKTHLKQADPSWLAIGAVMGKNYEQAEKMHLLYKEQIVKNVIQAYITKDYSKAAQKQEEYKTFLKTLANTAKQIGNPDYADALERKSTIFDAIAPATPVDAWLNSIDTKVIALAIEGIETYSKLLSAQAPSFWRKLFIEDRGTHRSRFYKEKLTSDSEAMTLQEKLIYLYALLASNDGERLKLAVSKALSCDSPEEARRLINQLLFRDIHGKEAIEQVDNKVAEIVLLANNPNQKGQSLALPKETSNEKENTNVQFNTAFLTHI